MLPTTVSFSDGFVVPIPTLPLEPLIVNAGVIMFLIPDPVLKV